MIPIQEFAGRTRVDQRLIESWVGEGWLIPHSAAEPLFTDLDVARARLIRELKEDFGVNDEGIGLILHLLDQVHGLRRQILSIALLSELCTRSAVPDGLRRMRIGS